MRRGLVSVALVAGLLAASGAGAAYFLRDEAVAGSEDVPETDLVSVERRTLTESEAVSGELGYDGAHTIAASGSGVLTRLPADGSVVRRGQEAYRVNDEPVVLLIGKLPLYRPLSDAVDDGADVAQLERNLAALGYDPGTVDEDFTASTREAVEDLQEDLGLEETGQVTGDHFLVLPSAVRVGAAKATIGTQLQPGVELYDGTGTARIVTIDLDVSDESLATKGAKAEVTLPGGRSTTATVASVGTVATAGTDESTGMPSGEATVPVTLTLDKPQDLEGLSAAPVTVDLTREVRADVLTVPVTALVALAEGGFAVRREGGELVAVEPGLYSDGYVEISGGLAEGDRIEVPA